MARNQARAITSTEMSLPARVGAMPMCLERWEVVETMHTVVEAREEEVVVKVSTDQVRLVLLIFAREIGCVPIHRVETMFFRSTKLVEGVAQTNLQRAAKVVFKEEEEAMVEAMEEEGEDLIAGPELLRIFAKETGCARSRIAETTSSPFTNHAGNAARRSLPELRSSVRVPRAS